SYCIYSPEKQRRSHRKTLSKYYVQKCYGRFRGVASTGNVEPNPCSGKQSFPLHRESRSWSRRNYKPLHHSPALLPAFHCRLWGKHGLHLQLLSDHTFGQLKVSRPCHRPTRQNEPE